MFTNEVCKTLIETFDTSKNKERIENFFTPQFTQVNLNDLADKGYQKALREDKNFLAGLNVCQGKVTYKAVADVFGHKYISPMEAIS